MTDAPMPMTRRPWSVSLSAAGVLLLLVSLALPWVDVNVDRDVAGTNGMQEAIDLAIEAEYGSETPRGISLDDGPVLLVLLVLFVGLLVLHHRRGRRGRVLPILALVVAAVATLVGVGNIADVGATSDDLREILPVSIDVAIGLYVVVVGGVLAMAGAAVAIATAAPKSTTTTTTAMA